MKYGERDAARIDASNFARRLSQAQAEIPTMRLRDLVVRLQIAFRYYVALRSGNAQAIRCKLFAYFEARSYFLGRKGLYTDQFCANEIPAGDIKSRNQRVHVAREIWVAQNALLGRICIISISARPAQYLGDSDISSKSARFSQIPMNPYSPICLYSCSTKSILWFGFFLFLSKCYLCVGVYIIVQHKVVVREVV